MVEVTGYSVWINGGPDGNQDKRSFIALDNNGVQVGYINFYDTGISLPVDHVDALGRIWMSLPSSMLENVLDILRNESPLYIWIQNNCGILSTSREPVGEGE